MSYTKQHLIRPNETFYDIEANRFLITSFEDEYSYRIKSKLWSHCKSSSEYQSKCSRLDQHAWWHVEYDKSSYEILTMSESNSCSIL